MTQYPGNVSPEEVKAMENILEKLNNVTQKVISESEEPVAVGNTIYQRGYKIIVNETDFGEKYFDIVDSNSNVIGKDLVSYEIANKIINYLNQGTDLYDKKIRRLLMLEEQYAGLLSEIKILKNNLEKSKGDRAIIIESKLSKKINLARKLREKIRML